MKLRTILLVEDDRTFRERLAAALRSRELIVLEAGSVSAAIQSAGDSAFDGAVVDLRMPGGTGLDVVSHLRTKHPSARIVLLTGYASIATAIQAVRLGADDYLIKPADADQILKALEGAAIFNTKPPPVLEPPSLHRVEWEHIQRVLTENDNNISRTARLLGLDRRSLQRKLAKHPPTR